MIEVVDLVKKYGDKTALDHFSFTFEDGKIYGLLGPNGAGKSTTMNIITGYTGQTGGKVSVDGFDILEEPQEARSRIGYLPEVPPLYTDMIVGEYLRFCAELKNVKKQDIESRVMYVLKKTHIEDIKDRLIKNLSKGYKQRVGLAGAIISDPKFIILDEPTVGLDPVQIIEIRDLIHELSKEHTIILSSHIMQEVSAVCDHILIISNGKLIATGSAGDLMSKLSGEKEIQLLLKGDEYSIKMMLSKFEQIKKIDISEKDELKDVVVVLDGESDIREDLFYACVKNDIPIYQMQQKESSLEDVFIELISSDRVYDEELSDNTGLNSLKQTDNTVSDNKNIKNGATESNGSISKTSEKNEPENKEKGVDALS